MWVNYPGERPVITGSMTIPTPTSLGANKYQVNLSGTAAETAGVEWVFRNGERLLPARTPNWNAPNYTADDPYLGSFFFTDETQAAVKNILTYREENAAVMNQLATKTGLKIFTDNWLEIWGWRYSRNVVSINTTTREITLDSNLANNIRAGDRYWIEGNVDLVSQNEFFYEPSARNLIFQLSSPLAAEDKITIPVVKDLVKVTGNHITWQGFEIKEFAGSAMYVEGSNSVSFVGNVVHLGEEGAFRTNYDAATNLRIADNHIYDIEGGMAIAVFGGQFVKSLTNTGNVITNNKIHNIDLYKAVTIAAILVDKEQVGVEVSGNEITRTPRHGIVVEGNNHEVLNNHIWQVGQIWPDAAPINVGSRTMIRRGTHFKGNYLHDPGGYVLMGYADWELLREGRHNGFVNNAAGISLMLDDWTSGALIEENILEAGSYGTCASNHGGRDNTYKNNYFFNCYTGIVFDEPLLDASGFNFAQFWPGIYNEWLNMGANGYDVAKYLQQYPTLNNIPQNPGQGEVMINNVVQKNIFDNSYRPYKMHRPGSNLVFSQNLIKYQPGGSFSVTYEAPNSGSYSDLNLVQWQALGKDTDILQLHSTEPLFENPPTDYTLRSNSSATANGFKQLSPQEAGVKTVVAPAPVVSAPAESNNTVPLTVDSKVGEYGYNIAEAQYLAKEESGSIISDWQQLAVGQPSVALAGAQAGKSYVVCVRHRLDSLNLSNLNPDLLWSNAGCTNPVLISGQGLNLPTANGPNTVADTAPAAGNAAKPNKLNTVLSKVVPSLVDYESSALGSLTDLVLEKLRPNASADFKTRVAAALGIVTLVALAAAGYVLARRLGQTSLLVRMPFVARRAY
jgi:hypothetical protein